MGLKSKIKNYLGISDVYDIPGTVNFMRDKDFFVYNGDGCEGFCIDFSCHAGVSKAYNRCSTLATVINRNAMAMANGKWWIVDDADNDVSDRYPGLKTLLTQPNPLQTFSEFKMQMDVFRQYYGEVFIYGPGPVGFNTQDASALWVINPYYIEIELSNKLYMQSDLEGIVLKYYLNVDGTRQELDKSRLLHIKDINQNLGFCQNNIRGKSRLAGLELNIANIIQAEEAIYALNRDRGAFGILSNDREDKIGPIPLAPREESELQEKLKNRYGLHLGQSKAIITEAKLKWQPMSFNVKDLMLIEGMDKNIQLVASAMGYPYELLGVMSSSSLNSNSGRFENQLKRMLYQDNIIPIADIYAQKFTSYFKLENAHIDIDFSHVESLKEAETEAADTLSKTVTALHELFMDGIISREEYRLRLGYDEEVYGEIMHDDGTGEN